MKRYGWRAFIVSFTLSLAVCMVVIKTADIWNSPYYNRPNSQMELPASYYEIILESYGSEDEIHDDTLCTRLFKVLCQDEEVIAILSCNNLYIYDPSGYYNTSDIEGGYFSKEDFQGGTEKGVLICRDSAYSLMSEDGKVYCFGEYRNVIGEYSKDNPLYKWSGTNAIRCLSPDIALTGNPRLPMNRQEAQIFLANCDKDMFMNIQRAINDAGWTVTADNALIGFVPEKPALGHVLRYLCLDNTMLVLLAFILGAVVLRRHVYAAMREGLSLRQVILRSIVPVLAGCGVSNAAAMVWRRLYFEQTAWAEALASIAIGTGMVLLLLACVLTGTGIKSRAAIYKKKEHIGKICRVVKKIGVPVMAVVLICLTITFTYIDMDEARYIIEGVWRGKSAVGGIQVVVFRPIAWGNREYKVFQEPDEALIKTMKEGKAFSVIQDSSNHLVIVGGKAIKDVYGHKWVQDGSAAYVCEDNRNIIKGDQIDVIISDRIIKVPVVESISKEISLNLGGGVRYSFQDTPLVILDPEDCMEAGALSRIIINDMYFLDAEGSTLAKYAMELDKAGIAYELNKLESSNSYYMSQLPYAVLKTVYIAALVMVTAMFLMAVTSITAEEKENELGVLLLHGAGFKSIWLRIFLIAGEIMVPVGIIAGGGWGYRMRSLYALSSLSVRGISPVTSDYIIAASAASPRNLLMMLTWFVVPKFAVRGTVIGIIVSALAGALITRRILRGKGQFSINS